MSTLIRIIINHIKHERKVLECRQRLDEYSVRPVQAMWSDELGIMAGWTWMQEDLHRSEWNARALCPAVDWLIKKID